MFSGCYNRLRETQKRPSSLRSRAGADHDQGDETDWGDQATPGTCILETKVGLRCCSVAQSPMVTVRQNGGCSGKATCTPDQKDGSQVDVRQTCGANGSGVPIRRERVGENESTKQEPECPYQGRWPIHGHGCRLAFTSLTMYCCASASARNRFFFALVELSNEVA